MRPAETVDTVWRLGRRPDPWAWPDWSYADTERTFGNRFDDPLGVYRVLYASTQRLATFVECLAPFRPDPAVLAEYEQIEGSDDDPAEPPPAGVVPAEWADRRCVGRGTPVGDFVDLGHHETLAELRSVLAARLVHHRIPDLDASSIRLSAPRAFTQEISRHIFGETLEGQRRWDGIVYRSRYGDDLENWAFFEPTEPSRRSVSEFGTEDPDLLAALELHSLRLS